MGRDIQKLFGNMVRKHRQGMSMSQEELAAAAGLHRTYIGGIERGERNVSLQNIFRLSRALNTSASELLKGIQ